MLFYNYITCFAHLSNCSIFVNLYNVLPVQDLCKMLELLTRHASILYEGIARQFSWKNFGFKLFLPSNALLPGVAKCLITIEPIGEGQFKFPDDSEPVSGIYPTLCGTQNY